MVKTKRERELEKEVSELEDQLDDTWIFEQKVFAIFITVLLSVGILFLVLFAWGVFESPLEKLNIDRDVLAKDYVVEYNPEYKSCSMVYDFSECRDNSINSKYYEAVKIYCGLDNRDGLLVGDIKNPIEIIYFEDITLEEIFTNKINEAMN